MSAIRESYIAQGLSERHLEQLCSLAELRTFCDGEYLTRQDDPNRDLYVLISGRALILSITGEPTGLVKPGMPIGEISFVDGKARSVSVVSDGPSEAIRLPAEPLWKLLLENHDMGLTVVLNVSRVVCARLRSANRNIAALMAVDEFDR